MGHMALIRTRHDPGFRCSICGAGVTDEAFCLGCRGYICGDCDEGAPEGTHRASDHVKLEEAA